jgi:fluoroacetyl-CoA thioesterase
MPEELEGYLGTGSAGSLVVMRPYAPTSRQPSQYTGYTGNFDFSLATPLGATVTARAALVSVNGRRLLFKVSAHDGTELIGEGTHERALIDLAKFEQRVAAKQKG